MRLCPMHFIPETIKSIGRRKREIVICLSNPAMKIHEFTVSEKIILYIVLLLMSVNVNIKLHFCIKKKNK